GRGGVQALQQEALSLSIPETKTRAPCDARVFVASNNGSETELGTDIEAVDALARIGEAAVVADPAGKVRREIGSKPHACAAPVLVRHEARQREGAGHADQAGADIARIGIVVMVPRNARERVQHCAAGLQVAGQLPTQRTDQGVTVLLAESHRGGVVAILAVTVDVCMLP